MNLSVEGRPLDEKHLVAQAKNGDASAYSELVRAHQAIALRVAFLVLGDSSEAEDATQSGLMKAYQALDRFRADSDFRPWLLRIVRNEAINRRRSAGRRAGLALKAGFDPVSGDAAPSPETVVVRLDESRLLLAAVQALPARLREVIEYRYFLGLSETEAARALGVAVGTVKSRSSRAIARLKEMPELSADD